MDKRILYYLCPTFAQIIFAGLIALILRSNGYVCGYDSVWGIILIIAGGVSSALWGCVYQVRYNDRNIREILKDFFHFKADIRAYMLVAVFMILDFLDVMISGSIKVTPIYIILVFLRSIAFGGIEEIGWRYTFQPFMEKKLPYFAATLATFVFWGIWHFLFFYIDGSISAVQVFPFLIGLLTNCFILSAIYNYSNDLWLCVLAHSLINTFSLVIASESGPNVYVGMTARIMIIIISIILSTRSGRKSEDDKYAEKKKI